MMLIYSEAHKENCHRKIKIVSEDVNQNKYTLIKFPNTSTLDSSKHKAKMLGLRQNCDENIWKFTNSKINCANQRLKKISRINELSHHQFESLNNSKKHNLSNWITFNKQQNLNRISSTKVFKSHKKDYEDIKLLKTKVHQLKSTNSEVKNKFGAYNSYLSITPQFRCSGNSISKRRKSMINNYKSEGIPF